MAVLTLVASGLTWSAAAQAAGAAGTPEAERAAPLGRARALPPALETAAVTLVPGTRISLDRGVIIPDGAIPAVRVSEREVTERVEVPYALRRVADPSLEQGIERVVSRGTVGEVVRRVVVRAVDGLETERTLVSEDEVSSPVSELRVVGTRPRPAPPAPGEVAGIVRAAADRWGADAETLLRVAWCESRYNPSAYNYSSGASGLFQFMPATFARNSVRAGFGDASIWDPVASANTAAYMFVIGQSRQWACK